MDELLTQIEIALNNNLYYLALYTTLTLPDICSSLTSEDGRTSGKQYIEWYNKYVYKNGIDMLDGSSCYKFRCSTLHQGNTQDKNLGYSRVIFVMPNATSNIFHENIIDGALNLDLKIFCFAVIQGVRKWLNNVKNDPTFITNYDKFMKTYPEGLAPYFRGIPIIS